MTRLTGRALDAEVAERCLGLYVRWHIFEQDYCTPSPDHANMWTAIPHCSENMGDAWRVVDLLESRGWWFEIVKRVGDEPPFDRPGWFARFRNVDIAGVDKRDAFAVVGTPAAAICYAALEVAEIIAERQATDAP